MGKRNYRRCDIESFGEHLISSGDLDPVYVGLVKADLPQDVTERWLLAYWFFYDCGVASWLSEFKGEDFWHWAHTAARNEKPTPHGTRWPRGHERRHARGAQGIRMVEAMQSRYAQPEQAVRHMAGKPEVQTCGAVMQRVTEHYLFGNWIAFKVADMVERVLHYPVTFDEAHVFMFKDPVKAAVMLWRAKHKLPETAKPRNLNRVLDEVVTYLADYFNNWGYQAPPLRDRPIGLQEVETVLCKWKSHMNGHYPFFNDTTEILKGVEPWCARSGVADTFLESLPTQEA